MDHLDLIERALGQSPVISVGRMQTSKQRRRHVLLDGGLAAMAKWNSEEALDGLGQIGREVAAWRLARALGLTALVPVTVLRDIAPSDGAPAQPASLQLLIADAQTGGNLTELQQTAVLEAAVFDRLIHVDSRTSSDNWLTITKSDRRRPMLIDHADAFRADRFASLSSLFVTHCAGTAVPDHLRPAIQSLANDVDGVLPELAHLIGGLREGLAACAAELFSNPTI